MGKTAKNIGLLDLSKIAGFSVNTVAKVLAGKEKSARISPKTAEKIRGIAKEQGYIPNMLARNLRSKQTGVIGVFIASMSDSEYIKLSLLILQELRSRGFSPLLTVAEAGVELCVQEWIQNRIEGLVLCGTTEEMNGSFFDELKHRNITPVVAGCAFMDPDKLDITELDVSTVCMDNYIGMQTAVSHLIDIKKDKIAYIAGPRWHADAFERGAAYAQLIKKYHDPMIITPLETELSWKGGYAAVLQIENRWKDCNAIIAYDDQIAIGAAKGLMEQNRKIPDEIAIIGFDNSPQSESCTPSLTTVAQPLQIITEKTVSVLASGLYLKKATEKIRIPPSLVIRSSTVKIF